MIDERIQTILANKELMESLLQLDTAQEVLDVLKEKGYDYTLEDVEKIKDLLFNVANRELDDDQLAAVAGGVDSGIYDYDGDKLFPDTVDILKGLEDGTVRRSSW